MIGFNKKILYECFIKLSITGEYILFTASSLRVGRSFESPRFSRRTLGILFRACDGEKAR